MKMFQDPQYYFVCSICWITVGLTDLLGRPLSKQNFHDGKRHFKHSC